MPSSRCTSKQHQAQPFRFMGLPPELRLLVYEHLRASTNIIKWHTADVIPHDESSAFGLVYHHIPVQILRVSRTIRNEARAIITQQLENILNKTPRITLEIEAHRALSVAESILLYVIRWLHALMEKENVDFHHWTAQYPDPCEFECTWPPRILRFIQQAGKQMLRQRHKLESLDPVSHFQGTASIFFAIQRSYSPSSAFFIPSQNSRLGMSDAQAADFAKQVQHVFELQNSVPGPLKNVDIQAFRIAGCSYTCIINWHLAVDAGDEKRIKTLSAWSPGLWDHLRLAPFWGTDWTIKPIVEWDG
jgi:hypothetical protein